MTDADDLDAFIQQQKAKIAKERNTINESNPKPDRRKWDKENPSQNLASSNRPATPEETGLALESYGHEDRRKKLLADRKKEYNDKISDQPISTRERPETPEYRGLPVGLNTDDEKQKKLQEDRKREYNDLISKNRGMHRTKENLAPNPDTPEQGIVTQLQLGASEARRKKLQDERKQEYNNLLAQKNYRRTGKHPDGEEFHGSIPGLEERLSAQDRKKRDTEEYKAYLNHQRQEQQSIKRVGIFKPYAKHDPDLDEDAPRGKSRRRDDDYATLPGLRDHSSAEVAKMNARNREYNDYLKSLHNTTRTRSQVARHPESEEEDDRPAPRKGWATPTYEEILDKKRTEERSYRKHNDPEYSGLKSSRSETNIHRPDPYEDDDRRFNNLDREYQSRKVRFQTEKPYVNPELEFSEWPLRSEASRPPPSRYDSRPPELPSNDTRPPDSHRAYSRPNTDPYGATLAIGAEQRLSADQRKKEAYKRELQLQMNEFKEHKLRERREDMKTNATGAAPVGGKGDRHLLTDRRQPPPPQRYRDDEFSPRAILFDDPRKVHGTNILENGFDDLYKPSFLNEPSALGQYRPPQDDAYSYYANRNPLDINPGSGIGYGIDPLSALSDRPTDRREKPRVTFDDTVSRKPDSTPARTAFPGVDEKSTAQKDAQKSYQEELKRQIEEQKMKKQKEREEKEKYDKKMDEEVRKYDPFGRGGGGAPMKDTEGNVIANWKQAKVAAENQNANKEADLRQMHSDVNDPYKSPRVDPDHYRPQESLPATSPRRDADTHARGGHGIFGEPITDAEKMKRNRYQDELRQQMEERKRHQDEERAKLQAEDARLLKKIEEDQQKMQAELDNEKRKEREKQEVAQKQQEELRRQQEEKRKEDDDRRKEIEGKRQDELRRQEDERRRERQEGTTRSSSPPIPTLRPKGEEPKQEQKRAVSPPLPAARSKTEPPPSPPVPAYRTQSRTQSRVASADVLNQLARMRQQLQSERKRVESDLKREQDEPQVFDPRLQHKPPSRNNVDVFEIARKKEAAPVRRPINETNPRNVDEFKKLKSKGGDSRQDFRHLFPQTPNSDDALETQQRVLLMQQEENLQDLRQRKDPRKDLNKMDPQDLGIFRTGSTTSAALLESDSAFIDVPEDQKDPYGHPNRNQRNDSARSRHRVRSETPKSLRADSMASLTSLDPESITRKNESRLRKLKSFTGDDASLASADADEVLDRFMAKQQHTRPPSEQTLVDDSWMRPGTRVT